ncbi:MAG: NAD(P)H-dependent glycerol-3-phosphate dehydrogenase [Planctomycetales bacterium]
MVDKVAILGAGAMGTGCAALLAERSGAQVTLWARTQAAAQELDTCRENRRLLPGVPLSPAIEVTSDLTIATSGATLLVVAIPCSYLRRALLDMAPYLPPNVPVVSVVKGIENDTFLTPSQIIRQTLGPRDVATLCGPSHAEEFARRLPASVVVAGGHQALLESVQRLFTTDRFRVYTNSDFTGVELAGALKNVIAIAAGICDGLEYGDNAKAALLTRGLAEMTRFGVALGGRQETFWGLAGVGDLMTTCFSGFGRNRRVGERLGQGDSLTQILAELHGVAEGVATCRSVAGLARERQIVMPICTEVYHVLFDGKSPAAATMSLMQRPLRDELQQTYSE